MSQHECGGKKTISVLFPGDLVGSGDQPQVINLDGKDLYPLSHIVGSVIF